MGKGRYIVAVDLGGSKIYSGLFLNGKFGEVMKFWTEADKGQKRVLDNLTEAIESAIRNTELKNIRGIGIAAPGPLDYKTGKILTTPNLPFRNFSLKKFLERRFKLEVRIDNDAKCAAVAEAKYRNAKSLIYLTLGTGTGSALIHEGKLFRGRLFATEFGHMSINFNGPRCGCGRRGCLEVYTNKNAVLRYAKELGLEQNSYEIQKKALQGFGKYKVVYKKLGEHLGIGLANIVNALDINLIVIGGGIGDAGNLVIKPAIEVMKKNLLVRRDDVKVEKAKLGNVAGLIGAAELFS